MKPLNLFVLVTFYLLYCNSSFCQNLCQVQKESNIYVSNSEGVKCLAKESSKKYTLIYVFAIWCKPCIENLPNAVGLSIAKDIDFYVLITEKEKSKDAIKNIAYLENFEKVVRNNIDESFKFKILFLSSSLGNSRTKRYKTFLKNLTPEDSEIVDNYSKFIVLDKNGVVRLITDYRDSENKTESQMIKDLILPILE